MNSNVLALDNARLIYDLLFTASAQTLMEIAATSTVTHRVLARKVLPASTDLPTRCESVPKVRAPNYYRGPFRIARALKSVPVTRETDFSQAQCLCSDPTGTVEYRDWHSVAAFAHKDGPRAAALPRHDAQGPHKLSGNCWIGRRRSLALFRPCCILL